MTTALFGVLLLVILWAAPRPAPGDRVPLGAAVARVVPGMSFGVAPIPERTERDLFLTDDSPPPGGRYRVIDQDRASWDELSRLLTRSPERLAGVRIEHERRAVGVWSPSAVYTRGRITIDPYEPSSDLARDSDGAYNAVLAYLRDYAPFMAGTFNGDALESAGGREWGGWRVDARALTFDAAAVVAALALISSLGWVAAVPRLVRTVRERRALRRGRCPGCGYTLVGLEPEEGEEAGGARRCPECGRRVVLP